MKARLQALETTALMRQKILRREILAGMPPGTPGTPQFVCMDCDTGDGVVTLVAAADAR